jgi:type II secretory pathway pseudopilin PulG
MVTSQVQRGFTYLAMLLGVAILGATLALTGITWRTVVQREKEAELLFVGEEFRRAIRQYYSAHGRYPGQIADLLKDPSYLGTRRYLRKLYFDPITATKEWGIMRASDGGIMGIYSPSNESPIKTSGFASTESDFESKTHYSEWRFVVLPPGAPQQQP